MKRYEILLKDRRFVVDADEVKVAVYGNVPIYQFYVNGEVVEYTKGIMTLSVCEIPEGVA